MKRKVSPSCPGRNSSSTKTDPNPSISQIVNFETTSCYGSAEFLSSRLGTPVAAGQRLCSRFATWFPGGATISRPYFSCTPAPHRTGQAVFPHPDLHSNIQIGSNGFMLTRIRGLGQPTCRRACSKPTQVYDLRWLRRFSHLNSARVARCLYR